MISSALEGKRVWVAGHRGMAGSALVRRLQRENCRILTVDRAQVDLRDPAAVQAWVQANRPQAVFVCAGKVGGILANSQYPADFLYDNLMIAANTIHAAHLAKVEKLVYLGSSCIYPRMAAQPMTEDMLLTGPLEPTNEGYAIAKIAGIKMCQTYRRQYGDDFVSAMPTNLYGPGDNYHPENSHVVAALIQRIHGAKMAGASSVALWGTGEPVREFLFCDDLADALVHIMGHYSDEPHINVGTGIEHSIRELAGAVADTIGFTGDFACDLTKPDGMPRKVMDVSRLRALGWSAKTPLRDGLAVAYEWFRRQAG
ncbi:GDP-L-fucose synthase [Magnetospirillum sp. 15-1]|uniref:GDP-L-fucose synthase family protein n=1 Tax=Magnetospirillum sp. 15-1 TaxID=1979370 RepID=UPI000BBC7360|nr:GDP-L-fucose synthase [Magnetospirillum sp. 15-1]